jgi:hypothetical protein
MVATTIFCPARAAEFGTKKTPEETPGNVFQSQFYSM